MLELDTYIALTPAAIAAPNLCPRWEDTDLQRIGSYCNDGYLADEGSREGWLRRNEAGMDLALQVSKDKTFPWAGCANVAFPLVTIAAQQFHARAYPAIVSPEGIVKVKVFGEDPDGTKTARGEKVAEKMNYQLLYEDKAWEDQEDKTLLNVSIVGTTFKKSYRSSTHGCSISELVLAKDLVVNYWARSLETVPRKTHKLWTFRNEVVENVRRGKWRDVLDEAWYKALPTQNFGRARTEQNQRQGTAPPPPDQEAPLLFLEQHCDLDLDGDGYAEPYIITFHAESQCVVRIVTRFDSESAIEKTPGGKVIKITPIEYFTKRSFIPSPDGGFYDIGFGVFLGPLNEAVNSLVNMLLDAGTMQVTAGGFLGRGAKIRGGVYTVSPFEWKRVDSSGDDLRKSLVQLPVNAPSDVLFQLLGLLIEYSSRVSGTTDITVGENVGQNTPAATAQTLNDNGQKIYTAVFKRQWRGLKCEFEKLYALNGRFLPTEDERALFAPITKGSYDICPVADPNITSDSMRVQLAMTLKAAAQGNPGYNRDAVERRFLKAIHVDNIKEVYPGTEGTPPPEDPKVTLEKLKQEGLNQRQQVELQSDMQQFILTLQEEQMMNRGKILELQAKAQMEAANAQNEAAFAQVALVQAEISRLKIVDDAANAKIEHYLAALKIQSDHVVGMKAKAKAAA